MVPRTNSVCFKPVEEGTLPLISPEAIELANDVVSPVLVQSKICLFISPNGDPIITLLPLGRQYAIVAAICETTVNIQDNMSMLQRCTIPLTQMRLCSIFHN